MARQLNCFDWNAERVEQLKALWAEGHSCSAIASIMGGGVSRNAIIGKVTRLNLVRRSDPASKRAPAWKPTPRPPSPPPPAPVYTGPPVHPRDLERHHCKFPIGDPQDKNFGFCGREKREDSSYCVHHHRVVYVPTPPRRDTLRAKPKAEQHEPDAVEMMEGRAA